MRGEEGAEGGFDDLEPLGPGNQFVLLGQGDHAAQEGPAQGLGPGREAEGAVPGEVEVGSRQADELLVDAVQPGDDAAAAGGRHGVSRDFRAGRARRN